MQVLDSMIAGVNIPYSYGFAIILLTILVKILTFPLTKKQVRCDCGCGYGCLVPALLGFAAGAST